MDKENKEEKSNAIKIILKLIKDEQQLGEYFYSGDKDTWREATNMVLNQYDIDWDKLNIEDRKKYSELYNDEIELKYEEIVSGWEKEDLFHEKMIKYFSNYQDFLNDVGKFENYEVENNENIAEEKKSEEDNSFYDKSDYTDDSLPF